MSSSPVRRCSSSTRSGAPYSGTSPACRGLPPQAGAGPDAPPSACRRLTEGPLSDPRPHRGGGGSPIRLDKAARARASSKCACRPRSGMNRGRPGPAVAGDRDGVAWSSAPGTLHDANLSHASTRGTAALAAVLATCPRPRPPGRGAEFRPRHLEPGSLPPRTGILCHVFGRGCRLQRLGGSPTDQPRDRSPSQQIRHPIEEWENALCNPNLLYLHATFFESVSSFKHLRRAVISSFRTI